MLGSVRKPNLPDLGGLSYARFGWETEPTGPGWTVRKPNLPDLGGRLGNRTYRTWVDSVWLM